MGIPSPCFFFHLSPNINFHFKHTIASICYHMHPKETCCKALGTNLHAKKMCCCYYNRNLTFYIFLGHCTRNPVPNKFIPLVIVLNYHSTVLWIFSLPKETTVSLLINYWTCNQSLCIFLCFAMLICIPFVIVLV